MTRINAFAAALGAALLASAAVAEPSAPPPGGPAKLRVGTFNIRCISPKDKGDRAWVKRGAEVALLIGKLKCDVIGLQEVTPAQLKYLRKVLGGEYGIVAMPRNGDGKSGESVPVCYLKSRLSLEKSGTFWLSKSPHKPGSRSWGTSLPRVCTWAVLKDKATGKRVCFANAHTDHKSEAARINGSKVIVAQLAKIAPDIPVVLVGDHNCNDMDAPAKYLRTVYDDAIYVSKTPPKGVWRSFTGWGKEWKAVPAAEVLKMKPEERKGAGGTRIDFIYVSKTGVRVRNYLTVKAKRKCGEWFSDHLPVIATIELK